MDKINVPTACVRWIVFIPSALVAGGAATMAMFWLGSLFLQFEFAMDQAFSPFGGRGYGFDFFALGLSSSALGGIAYSFTALTVAPFNNSEPLPSKSQAIARWITLLVAVAYFLLVLVGWIGGDEKKVSVLLFGGVAAVAGAYGAMSHLKD